MIKTMTGGLRNHGKLFLAALGWVAVVVGPVLSHLAITAGRVTAASVLVAVGQMGALAVVAWRGSGWQRALGVAAACGLLALFVVRLAGAQGGGIAGLMASSGLSHAVIYGSLLVLFGQSLRPGRTALVTGLAQRFRGRLTPAMVAYTRTVTKAWCVFCLAQLVVSATLLGFAADRTWSLFVNVLDGPSIVAMFLVEFGIRTRRFRDGPHASPWAVARAFTRDRAGG